MDLKKCSKCGIEKSLDSFLVYKSGKMAGYRRPTCRKCSAAQVKAATAKNIEHYRARQRRYYAANPHMNIRSVMSRYGQTEVWYEMQLKKQNGVCAICGDESKSTNKNGTVYRLAADHDHHTGNLRGLLCTTCNNRLGVLEQHDWLPKAMAYLKQHEPL